MNNYTIRHGDCLEVLSGMADNSVDSIVTDPPYGLSFMGKKWDYDVPSADIWRECLRVLKPGGHLLAFAGTRTQHWMAVNIEDAGFEIRDMIAWVYGSGFPKSLDVSKAIDKAAGAERDAIGINKNVVRVSKQEGGSDYGGFTKANPNITAPSTAARQWQGWGTALKPAMEPITVARKPLIGTVAENVLAHGTGGINVDVCRVGAPDGVPRFTHRAEQSANCYGNGRNGSNRTGEMDSTTGRWPANLIHDGSDEVVQLFPNNNPGCKPHTISASDATAKANKEKGWGSVSVPKDKFAGFNDGENKSAARFFYCAKASKADRGADNRHPTVKPTALMRYLCRLVTPQNGIVLDPFMGSGSTGKAAILEGFGFIGIEREAEYVEIAKARIASVTQDSPTTPEQREFQLAI